MKPEMRDMLIRWANRTLFFLNTTLCIVFLAFFSSRSLKPTTGIEYKDLIVIILTAVTVLLAAVTLFVGVIAIYGYSTIRDQANRLAIATARESVADLTTNPAAARKMEEQASRRGVDQPSAALVAELQENVRNTEDASDT